jgi:hypothetical protein
MNEGDIEYLRKIIAEQENELKSNPALHKLIGEMGEQALLDIVLDAYSSPGDTEKAKTFYTLSVHADSCPECGSKLAAAREKAVEKMNE